jgi:hypothetical protein
MYIYPLSLSYDIKKAELRYDIRRAQMDIETTKNGYKMESHPIKIQIDNEDFFNSIGMKTVRQQVFGGIQKGKEAVKKFMERKAGEKNALLSPDKITIAEVYGQRQRHVSMPMSILTFIPAEKPKISWAEGYVDIEYKKDDIDISWDPGSLNFLYIPFSIEFYVDKWAKI